MSEVAVRGAGRSIINYRIAGRHYPMKNVGQCKTCQSPHRFEIEEQLVAGRTYAKIIASLPDDADLSVRNVKDHYLNNHLPLEAATSREIAESRARRVGKSIEDYAGSLIDGITLLETVVQKTFEDIAAGRIKPDVADGIRAAKVLAQLGEYDEGGVDQQAIVEAFMVYHEQAQANMTPEQFRAFGEALDENPVLRALASRYDGEQVVSGEVVEQSAEALAESLDNED